MLKLHNDDFIIALQNLHIAYNQIEKYKDS